MRKALFGIGALALVVICFYDAHRDGALHRVPLKWNVVIDEYEQVHHVDKDRIYCAAIVSAGWGSISSVCGVERNSGKVLWRRKKTSKDIWDNEYPLCWGTDVCFAGNGVFDRVSKKKSKNRITAFSLRDGSNLWEVPVSEDVRSLALGESLYSLTKDGRLTAHQVKTGAVVSELNLHDLAGPRASYGGVKLYGNIAIVESNLSLDYTNVHHAKVFLVDLRNNRLIAEYPIGQSVDGSYVIYTGEEWRRFDPGTDDPKGVLLDVPELCFPVPAFDRRSAVWGQKTERGWRMLSADMKPIGPEFTERDRLMHISKEALYYSDSRMLRSVDRRTGAVTWSVRMHGVDNVSASPLQVVVTCRGGTLQCLNTRSGTLQWKCHLKKEMGQPVWCDGDEVILSDEGNLLYFAR